MTLINWIIQRLKSRTNQFMSIMTVLFTAIEINMHLIEPVFGDKIYYIVALIWGVGGIFMREITTKPVTEK